MNVNNVALVNSLYLYVVSAIQRVVLYFNYADANNAYSIRAGICVSIVGCLNSC